MTATMGTGIAIMPPVGAALASAVRSPVPRTPAAVAAAGATGGTKVHLNLDMRTPRLFRRARDRSRRGAALPRALDESVENRGEDKRQSRGRQHAAEDRRAERLPA